PLLPYSAASVGRPGQERRQGGYQLAGFGAMGSVSGARGTLTWYRCGRQPRPGRGRFGSGSAAIPGAGEFRPSRLLGKMSSTDLSTAAERQRPPIDPGASGDRRTRWNRPWSVRALALLTAVALGAAQSQAPAQTAGPKGPPVIRDAEIEQLL